jgi:hypothetical protein
MWAPKPLLRRGSPSSPSGKRKFNLDSFGLGTLTDTWVSIIR